MSQRQADWREWLGRCVWFALVLGLTARLGDEVRVYAALRAQRHHMAQTVAVLRHRVRLLENKLRYLHTPDGVQFVRRLQGVAPANERLFIFPDGLPLPADIVDLLPGGLEEWHNNATAGSPVPPRSLPPHLVPHASPTGR
ncbi:hypothetical protein HRbin17_00007 [bacterium HR17]|uniref:Uncharacterized protein n=1 Tax=Candidatus Fervidibacter japonicus TaxID=2035412 RepID=A0A2H5X8J6_9BACT|nr:hypothetical protein HRbin17_00007 [bacterium HR17]